MKAIVKKAISSADFPKANYSAIDKQKLLEHLRSFDILCTGGLVYDYVINEDTSVENICYTNGEYTWQEEELYHIEKYDAALSDEFLMTLTA